ncbi:MAG: type I DNA topoisomerase [Planctomycetota bacterium]|jgi:DNA topoisomerase-1
MPAKKKKTTTKKAKAKTPQRKKSLVIVESPAKARTIHKYLGRGYLVRHSLGHVRDLPKSRLGVDMEDGFKPKYLTLRDRKPVLDDLKKALKSCDKVYLATDPDREGEAIAWHLKEALKLSDERVHRITTNEITRRGIKHAMDNPRHIDANLVNAQQARRILDRIVGYKLSPLLWEKVAKNLSAGRVQSVAVMLVVDREREIRAFEPKEYWKIAQLLKAEGGEFKVHLKKRDGQLFEPDSEPEAMEVVAHLKAALFKLAAVTHRRKTDRPPPPFKTSTLQQAASNALRFAAKRTMRVAQQLYEGVDVGEGSVGLVTYMRTDSFNVSSEAIGELREFIPTAYGKDYLPEKPNFFRAGKRAQEAHEAIRPTSVMRTPEQVKPHLTKDQYRLYELIWRRFVASQMTPAVFDITEVCVEALGNGAPTYELRCQGKTGVFDGYQKVAGSRGEDVVLPPLTEASQVEAVGDPDATQNFTKPPPRYTEATLVKSLERQGIGRPSTYAAIISTVQDRGYVYQEERKFHASELGELVTDLLRPFFPEILDVTFTAGMETKLDGIEEGGADWVSVLREFWGPFSGDIEKALEQMRNLRKDPEKAERECPECKKGMVYRWRGASKYLACVDYPECRTTISLDRDGKEKVRELTEHRCQKCDRQMVLRSGRFGKFLACSGYPDCRSTISVDKEGNPIWPEKWPEPCPECGQEMVVRRGRRGRFVACTGYPQCKKTLPYRAKKTEEAKAAE